jgi:hypothetical protein
MHKGRWQNDRGQAGEGGCAGSILPPEGVVPGGIRYHGAPLPSDNGTTDGGAGGTLLAVGFLWRTTPNQPPGTSDP